MFRDVIREAARDPRALLLDLLALVAVGAVLAALYVLLWGMS